jgi:hypothetical protein
MWNFVVYIIFHNKAKPILDIFLFFSFGPMMDHDLLTEPKKTKKNIPTNFSMHVVLIFYTATSVLISSAAQNLGEVKIK